MSLILKELFTLFKLLNSETGTRQVALGMSLGFILGMSPTLSLQSLLIFLILLIFRIQFGAAFISAFIFKFVAFLFDPFFHKVGHFILKLESLQEVYTSFYNMPIIPFTRFNNTVVMGSGVVGIIVFPFVYFIFKLLVSKYRETIVARFRQTRFWKMVQATRFYKWYHTYDQYFGA